MCGVSECRRASVCVSVCVVFGERVRGYTVSVCV